MLSRQLSNETDPIYAVRAHHEIQFVMNTAHYRFTSQPVHAADGNLLRGETPSGGEMSRCSVHRPQLFLPRYMIIVVQLLGDRGNRIGQQKQSTVEAILRSELRSTRR